MLNDTQLPFWLHRLIAGTLINLRPASIASSIKAVFSYQRQIISTGEGDFYVDFASNLGYKLLTKGLYEPKMIQTLKTYLKPHDIFIDLGANEGYFSVVASNLVKSNGRVFAIEPQSRLQPIINKNIELNSCNNVQVTQVAISSESETVTLFVSPDMNTGSTSLIQSTRYSLPKQEVNSITLAEFFKEQRIDICDLIKIDIEGYEYEAIMNSPELFQSHRFRAIALELHPHYLEKRGLSGETITKFLIDCGYSLTPVSNNTELLFVLPECNIGATA